ncbi:MAG: alpha-amylase/4-alpha-glucanotransferase domain-containing protein, partial [Planctomycetaceae bacterium]
MDQLRLALVIHNHQPIGNFDEVCHQAFHDSYRPFLDVLAEFPNIGLTLHNSGSLLEWLVDHRPEYLDQVRGLLERGQLELLGGPFYEPILSGIPQRDRIGQTRAYSMFLEQHFGQKPRGAWVPERVWEQAFTKDLVDAGIEYTVLDDFHFRCAGLQDEELDSFFVTEDEGRVLRIFPVAERLRYSIPFQAPEESIDFLRGIYETSPQAVVTFGDDGEKFGTWPETHRTCYEEGWLRRFFQMLSDNGEWLKAATLGECVDNVVPAGKIYLSDSSYREMTEWVLPPERQKTLLHLRQTKQNEDPDWNTLSPFVRGGFWRNFLTKYPESNEMYSRMLTVSQRLAELEEADADRDFADRLSTARMELYRGQCNCSYWHGAFGGLYLPHLRHAVYRHLIAADTILEQVGRTMEGLSMTDRPDRWVRIESRDFDCDSRPELRLSGDRMVVFLTPGRGGQIYELDVRAICRNLLGTLNRRPEIYHDAILRAARGDSADSLNAASIQSEIRCKQADLHEKIACDSYPRKALVDHFLKPGLSLEEFRAGSGLESDFHTGIYQSLIRRSADRVEAALARRGCLDSREIQLTKIVALDRTRGGTLEIQYRIDGLPPGQKVHFGIEFNLSGLPGGVADRYYYDFQGRRLGQLESVFSLSDCQRIGLTDEWLGVDVSLDMSQPSGLWVFPIESVSQS